MNCAKSWKKKTVGYVMFSQRKNCEKIVKHLLTRKVNMVDDFIFFFKSCLKTLIGDSL